METLGGWFQTQDVIYDNPTEMLKAPLGTSGRGYAMLSSGGLAGTVNNSGIEAATKLTAKFYQDENKKVIGTIGDGTLTVRTPLDLKNNTRRLPWSTVAICADHNGDSTVDWQDAAANYRNIRTEIYGMDTMKDNMMYITMNFASQVQQPFLRTLDLGKSIYNYTDGFGQMVMHKGFAAEGHDDSHADYGGHVGVRQGGAADFNYAMEQGEKYNMKYGIHINVSEHNPDAYYFNEDIMHRPLGANWGWIDQAYWVNEREDILSGNRAANLARLKATLPKLAFTYIDIYNGSTWMAEDLVKELNKNGFIAGTEFGGSMELGAAFTHWGHDRAYPNHGNNSTILRFVKPDLDIFVTNALFNGSNMPLVGSWGNANNVKDASQSFFNNVLPAKYLQHLNVLKVTDTSVTFSDGVKTERKGDTVEMTKDGKLMASWAWIEKAPAAGATDPQNWAASDTGPATVFIPWYGEASTAKNPEEAAKVYHWNPEGGTTSWDVPAQWTAGGITSADVYQLSGDKKEKINTVAVENGKITLTAAAETGYVLYPAGSAAPKVATGFGSGSGMQNTGFEDTSLAGWTVDKAAGADASVMKTANWETRLKIAGTDGQSASLTQPITGLEAGKDYTLYLFANAGETGRVDVTVTAGDETYTSAALPTTQRHFDQSKYFNLAEDAGAYDNFQKVSVPFHVPAGVTTATLTIKGTLGADSGKVFADDVTLFDNLTVPKIAGRGDYKDYVLYEDFENVDQGLGAFTYSYLSGGYTHLAEYKAEMNQFTDYVVSGNFSLKSNEFGLVGEALRTRPNQSKLEANTQYELTCRYETGVNGAYALTVKRPNGTVVCSAPLDAVPLRGEGAAVKVSFATGDYDDAYLALEYKADITKLPYASAGEKPEGSGMEYYYLSLDDVAIKKAETGTGEKIISLGAMRTNTYKGVAPVLMGRVAATYEGGRKGYVDVVWAEIDPATLAAAGTLTVKGTVQGTALPAEYTVTVMETESMASTADLRALVSYGKAQQKAPAYAIVIPAVKTAFEQALTAAEAGCGEAAPDTQPSGSYYTLLARTHLLGYVGDKAQLDALDLASNDLTRGDTAEA
ncbi:MAG: endo-alpha-N-acetylgalactosaminidase family protein, partial [Oscillospiraceae bacterium]